MSYSYSLSQVLSAAAVHPFYSSFLPSSEDTSSEDTSSPELSAFPLLDKHTLHALITSAIDNDQAFLKSVYISPTSGTSGTTSRPLFFITDALENRRQREKAGRFINAVNGLDKDDVVMNLHIGRAMYRSLELTGDLIEHAGATNVPAGFDMSDSLIVEIAKQFHANAIASTSSRLLTLARYLVANPDVDISFKKVIYTSEALQTYQEAYLRRALRCESIVSLYGSAECGPWAISPPNAAQLEQPYREFIFETDSMVIEVLDDDGIPTSDGEVGEIVVTSLVRLRNPLVRYRTGDIGTLHPYSVPDQPQGKYQCVRFYGRHPGKSFVLSSEKFDIVEVKKVIEQEKWGVLEWQVILDSDHQGQDEESAEFRVVFQNKPDDKLVEQLRLDLLYIGNGAAGIVTGEFRLKAVEYADLVKSPTAGKIRRVVDNRT
ncbi:hypothetical protein RUND412_009821 [Rhizina undulata]